MVVGGLVELPRLLAAIWTELAAAPRDKSHGFRLGVLATVGQDPVEDEDGDEAAAGLPPEPPLFADARTVVLRDVDVVARELLIYTDSRSPKVHQLAQHPLGTLVLWSPQLGWQLRLRVELGVMTSGLQVSSRWARLKMTPAAQDYLSPLAPGSRLLGSNMPERASREHFAVLRARVTAVDWLELGEQGHRRARFDGRGARWVAP